MCTDMCRGMCRDSCMDMCIDMCMDMCFDMYTHMCIDTCRDMCVDLCVDMCIDMCTDICTDICTDMCLDMRARCTRALPSTKSCATAAMSGTRHSSPTSFWSESGESETCKSRMARSSSRSKADPSPSSLPTSVRCCTCACRPLPSLPNVSVQLHGVTFFAGSPAATAGRAGDSVLSPREQLRRGRHSPDDRAWSAVFVQQPQRRVHQGLYLACTHARTHARTCTSMCALVCVCMRARACMCACVHVCMHAYVRVYVRACVRARAFVRARARARAQSMNLGRHFVKIVVRELPNTWMQGNQDFFNTTGGTPKYVKTDVLHLSQNFRTTQENCDLNAAIQDGVQISYRLVCGPMCGPVCGHVCRHVHAHV